MKIFILFCSSFILSVYSFPNYFFKEPERSCGYSSCPETDPNLLNIHIVPHSHDDVGWLKTMDQYFYGSKNFIQHAGVQYILDSVIQALSLHHERRFIYVETAFFWKWWKTQPEVIRKLVQNLVNNGQLEIIGGAWTMNDEATTHYQSTIDQFTWGFRKLDETLGKCARPKIGWQIDPFGHSREQASLFAQFGFDGLFFGRLDYRDYKQRLDSKNAEFLWQGSQSLGSDSRIFSSVLFNNYMTPPGFCFDVMCEDSPIIDDVNSTQYNAKLKANIFLNYAKSQAKYYKTNNVLITMGGDFHYQDALSYFSNIDRLIRAMRKEDQTVKAFYSSPSCYLKAVNDALETYNVKVDDFFPYASDEHSYWTGYFSSRPTLKRMERLGNNILQVSKQLATAAFVGSFEKTAGLDPLREAMAVMQHHDAITGTEKQHVADDYALMLHKAMESSTKTAEDSLKKLYFGESTSFQSCLLLNISQCEPTEQSDKFLILVYNPLSRIVSHYVRIPVSKSNYIVYDSSGKQVEIQIVPIFRMIANMPGRNSTAIYEILFRADNIPALGQRVFYVQIGPAYTNFPKRPFRNENNIKIKLNNKYGIRSYLFDDEAVEITPQFLFYNSEVGNNMDAWNRSSGAYIFRPKEKEAIHIDNLSKHELHFGPHVTEYFEQMDDWIGRITRIYEKYNHIELNWIVGPIPLYKNIGKEVITRYKTPLKTRGVFYTDSNGREIIRRIRDYRSSYNLTNEEPVSQNYYPVTSKITIADRYKNIQISVLNDRAQGGSSLHDGDIELMVHRRLFEDDAFGVEEPLNEKAFGHGLVATGKQYITVNKIETSNGMTASAKERLLAQEISKAPWLFISPLENNYSLRLEELHRFEISMLKKPLPKNIQILTLEPWGDNKILLRLEHILEIGEDLVLSKQTTIDLSDMFLIFDVKHVDEMTLGANQRTSELKKLQWLAENDYYSGDIFKTSAPIRTHNDKYNSILVTLSPMEIKTFIIDVKYKV